MVTHSRTAACMVSIGTSEPGVLVVLVAVPGEVLDRFGVQAVEGQLEFAGVGPAAAASVAADAGDEHVLAVLAGVQLPYHASLGRAGQFAADVVHDAQELISVGDGGDVAGGLSC
ncbi:hypothetical protein BA062_38230 [Prauserella flavalba]|uniref:Uncharacterized protein n=1 Tax=Prauserella flavalba TaxID=1477506 RepID=A0A318L9I7_9PSEU|nr:hypothetical protein BA062_38230 [Prauserella flavalba]